MRDFVVFQGASGWTLAERGRLVLSLVSGPGSDLSEEPVFQDVEPATLDYRVVPECPPGPNPVQLGPALRPSATKWL